MRAACSTRQEAPLPPSPKHTQESPNASIGRLRASLPSRVSASSCKPNGRRRSRRNGAVDTRGCDSCFRCDCLTSTKAARRPSRTAPSRSTSQQWPAAVQTRAGPGSWAMFCMFGIRIRSMSLDQIRMMTSIFDFQLAGVEVHWTCKGRWHPILAKG
jgi:hypothetical protein